MCAAKAMLWSEILRTFTTAPVAGRTRAPAWQLEPPGRPLTTSKEQKSCWRAQTFGGGPATRSVERSPTPDDRFDKALVAWENTGQPHAKRLEAQRERLGAEAAQLEQARASREDFLAQHPEVPSRLAELHRAIEREQEHERRRSWELLKEREQARQIGISQDLERGYGVEI